MAGKKRSWKIVDGKIPPDLVRILKDHLAKSKKYSLDQDLAPPWVEFPDIPRYSIGWRMGPGEDYM